MRSFVTFLAAYVLSQFYRSFLAVIAPELARDLALDPQGLGNLQAWWIAGFVVMQIPVGYALDNWGPRRSVAALMLPAVLGAALFARATTEATLDAAIFLIGVGCSSPFMGALYVFGRINRPERFATLSSLLIAIGSTGNLLAATPLAWAMHAYGWRTAVTALALANAASAITVFVLVRDPPRAGTAGGLGVWAGLATILRIKSLWPLLPITLISYAVLLAERGLWAGPFFSSVYGLDVIARGNALLVMAAAMSLGALAYAPLDRWFNTRKAVVVAGTAMTGLGFLILGGLPLPLPAAIAVLAITGAAGMTYAVLMAHGRAMFPEPLLGRGITFMNMLFMGGAGLLQPASGAMMAAMQNLPPATAYARLHTGFGLLLCAALAVYMLSRDMKPT